MMVLHYPTVTVIYGLRSIEILPRIMPRPATGQGASVYIPALNLEQIQAYAKALANGKPDYKEAIAQLEAAIAILKTKLD